MRAITTKEHVYEMVERLDAEGLDVERLNEDQLSALERELSSILLRFGWRDEPTDEPKAETKDDGDERPYDPLGGLIGMIGDEYDGPTDVSVNKYKYIADAIEGNWARE